MTVDGRRVAPVVVRIARHVARIQRDLPVQEVDRARQVALHIERVERRRPQLVAREVAPALRPDAQLLVVTQDADALAHGRLRLEIAVLKHHVARARVEEVHGDVGLGRHARAVGEGVAAFRPRQHHQLRGAQPAERHAGQLLDCGARGVSRQARRRVEIDPGVQHAEGRHRLTLARLPGHVTAEHPDAPIVLVRAFVQEARQERVRDDAPHLQVAAAKHGVDPRVPFAQLGDRSGLDTQQAGVLLRDGRARDEGERHGQCQRHPTGVHTHESLRRHHTPDRTRGIRRSALESL